MSRYKNKLHVLRVRLHSKSGATNWYFDLNEQAELAQALCKTHPNVQDFTAETTTGEPPADDFISDFSEFEAWVNEAQDETWSAPAAPLLHERLASSPVRR